MQGNRYLLTRTECNVMRGIAIIGIFLHNYCHWLRGIVKENEYQYFQNNVDGLERVLHNPDLYLPVHLLSFFGHYGVPVFLFLSAYGLVLKYESRPYLPKDNNWQSKSFWSDSVSFTRYHFLKLFKMMIVGFVAFTIIDYITPGPHHYKVLDIVAQLGMFNNVLPNPDRIIWPGPYWFFGLMLQLYIVYRLFLHHRHWAWTVAFMVVCTGIQLLCEPEGDALNRWRYNFIGGMLPFGAGILFARFGKDPQTKLWYWGTLIVAATLVYTQSNGYWNWFSVPFFVIMTCYGLVKVLPQFLLRPLEWMGGISAALFICHPITRKIFIPISRQGDVYTGLLLYIVASIAMAWLFKELLKRIPNPKQ